MQVGTVDIFNSVLVVDFFRAVIYISLFLYIIFALLILRQVSLMSKTLMTPVSPTVKAIAIIHAGIAIGFGVFVFGTL